MGSLMSQELTGGAMAYRRGGETEAANAISRRNLRNVVLFFLMLFTGALFYVWTQAQVVQASYGLAKLQAHEKGLVSENDKLKLEIATLRSPAVLSEVAAERLDMVLPEHDQIVMVK